MFVPPRRRLSSAPPSLPPSPPLQSRRRRSSPPPRRNLSSHSQPLSGQQGITSYGRLPLPLPSDTGSNPRSLSPDTGSNPPAFRRSAYTGENRRINPDNQIDMEHTLDEISERDYSTPTYGNSPYSSPANSPRTIVATRVATPQGGKYSKNVYKKVGKKEVLGKDRVIYKMKGSNKEYLKSKGMYIPVSEYKKLKK
jgi:hypothetical protein